MGNQSKFDRAFTLLIGEEGGYVNDKRDPGGETKFGIAKKYHPDVDIKSLTIAQAKAIYREEYWEPFSLDLVGWPVAYVLFDGIVNMGPKTAIPLMQEALGELPDGIVGPRTRAALKAQGRSRELVVRFQAERGLYYASRGHFDRFGRGWIRRVIRGALDAFDQEAAA